MLANYHTHTIRCKHAVGSEREYIESAIDKGFKILGFSDHVPQPYPEGFVSPIRMDMSELKDYTDTLLGLRSEYKDKIQILIGYEVEYSRQYFRPLIRELKKYPLDFMILGQHHVPDEVNGRYVGFETTSEKELTEYVDFCIEGMETGLFLYLAHPDLIRFKGADDVYMKQMERLAEAMADLDIPAEVNMYGFADGRNYPCDSFFDMASKKGLRFIVGCDAHSPKFLMQPEELKGFNDFLKRNRIEYGDNVIKVFDIWDRIARYEMRQQNENGDII